MSLFLIEDIKKDIIRLKKEISELKESRNFNLDLLVAKTELLELKLEQLVKLESSLEQENLVNTKGSQEEVSKEGAIETIEKVDKPITPIAEEVKTELKTIETPIPKPKGLDSKAVQKIIKKETPVKEKVPFEKLAYTWLTRVFMFILLLGVLWIFNIAVDNGYISEPIRLIIGLAVSLGFGYFGYKTYLDKKQKIFGTTLIAGFISIGIIVIGVGYNDYQVLPLWLAFGLGLIYIGVGIYLSIKCKSEIIALFSAIALFILPFVVLPDAINGPAIYVYLTVSFLALTLLAFYMDYKYSYYIFFGMYHVSMVVITLVALFSSEIPYLLEGLAVALFIQHFTVVIGYLQKKSKHTVLSEGLLYLNFVVTSIWLLVLSFELNTDLYIVYAGMGLAYASLAYDAFNRNQTRLFGMHGLIAVFALSNAISSFTIETGDLVYLIIGTGIMVLASVYMVTKLKSYRFIVAGLYNFGLMFYLTVFSMAEEGLYEEVPFLTMSNLYGFIFIITVIVATLMIKNFFTTKEEANPSPNAKFTVLVGSMAVSVILFLEGFYLQSLVKFEDYSYSNLYFIAGYLQIVFVLIFAFFKQKVMTYTVNVFKALYLLVVVYTLFIPLGNNYDDEVYIFNIFVSIATIIVLLAVHSEWIKGTFKAFVPSEKLIAFSYPVMQVVVFLSLNKWIISLQRELLVEGDFRYLIHTSILLIYAFATIYLGKKLASKGMRYVAIAIVLICIGKLFFIDLQYVSLIVRAILFCVVGAIGLIFLKQLVKDDKKEE